jgi:hypothetical protein
MIYMLNYIKVDAGVQTILKFSLRNFIGFNACITDGGYL